MMKCSRRYWNKQKILKSICDFGKGSGTKEDFDEAIAVLTVSDSSDYVKNLVVSFVEEGKARIFTINPSPSYPQNSNQNFLQSHRYQIDFQHLFDIC